MTTKLEHKASCKDKHGVRSWSTELRKAPCYRLRPPSDRTERSGKQNQEPHGSETAGANTRTHPVGCEEQDTAARKRIDSNRWGCKGSRGGGQGWPRALTLEGLSPWCLV